MALLFVFIEELKINVKIVEVHPSANIINDEVVVLNVKVEVSAFIVN
jgi:hypothetical protein